MATIAWPLTGSGNFCSSTSFLYHSHATTNNLSRNLPAASSSLIVSIISKPLLPSVTCVKQFLYPTINSYSGQCLDQEAGSTERSMPRQAANSCPLTPLGFLERAATVYGDCPSVVYNSTKYTWSETYIRCVKLASAIASLGIKKGEVVSVVAPNVPAMYELHFAVPMANAIINTINLRLDARTISILLQHSESKVIFVDHLSSSLVLEAISQFPANSNKPMLVVITEDHQESSPSPSNGFHDTYENMIKHGDFGFKWIPPDCEWDPITLNYTSGTTSSPKGVLHSHRARFIMAMDSLLDWPLPKQSIYLWTLPMFHANGWSYTWGTAAVGAVNVCLRQVNAPSIYEAINKNKVTHMCGAPAVLNVLSNFQADSKSLDHPVHILTAGAPPPAAVLSRAESLGFRVSHGYGLTETAGLVVTCAWKQEWNELSALERAKMKARQGVRTAGFTEVDVVEPDTGISVKRNGSTMGEIVLRGGSIMLSYHKDSEATSKCMKNGWFYTGDVGVMHPDGYLEVRDRSKDVIICGGENLSSVEVESVLYTHPAVNEAAVVAKPEKFWGETPCAFVSLKAEIENKPSEKDLREFCKSRLPLYMVPRTFVFKEELPKTSTGKIQKFLLREMAKVLG